MIKTWLTKLIRNRNLSIEFLCWDTWSNGHFLSLNTFYSKSLSVLVYFLFLHIFCPWTFFVLRHFLSLDTFCHRTLFVLGQFLSLDTVCPWTLSTLGCFLAWNSVTTLYSLKLSGLVHFLCCWDTFCPFLAQPIFSISLACLTKIDNRAHHLC